MSDDTARRDAWRGASRATTVTGGRVQPEPAPREGIHEDHVPHGHTATDPANAAPEGDVYRNVSSHDTYLRAEEAYDVALHDDLSEDDRRRYRELLASETTITLTDSEQDRRIQAAQGRAAEVFNRVYEGDPVTFVPEDD
jgi:hypothetical protein